VKQIMTRLFPKNEIEYKKHFQQSQLSFHCPTLIIIYSFASKADQVPCLKILLKSEDNLEPSNSTKSFEYTPFQSHEMINRDISC
jgi:hypothetical protein